MSIIFLLIATIPLGPRIINNDENFIEIKAPPQLCYDSVIAFANNVEPDWRANPFPVWVALAQEAKDSGRIIHNWIYYGEEQARKEKELLLGLIYFGYKNKYE